MFMKMRFLLHLRMSMSYSFQVRIFKIINHSFLISWQPETKFLFSRSRLPLKDSKGPFTFVENQEIEVYSKANEQEAFGWWKAVIKVFCNLIIL